VEKRVLRFMTPHRRGEDAGCVEQDEIGTGENGTPPR